MEQMDSVPFLSAGARVVWNPIFPVLPPKCFLFQAVYISQCLLMHPDPAGKTRPNQARHTVGSNPMLSIHYPLFILVPFYTSGNIFYFGFYIHIPGVCVRLCRCIYPIS